MKKIIACLSLCVVMLFACGVSVFADGGEKCTLVCDSVTAIPGSEVAVSVYVPEGSGLAGVDITLEINSDLAVIVPDKCERGDNVTMSATETTVDMVYAVTTGTNAKIKLATVVISISSELEVGKYEGLFTLKSDASFTNEALDEVEVDFKEPSLKITGRDVGDIYDDGKVNVKDAIYLLQYLANMVEISEQDFPYANAYVGDNYDNGSPKINVKDAVLILQYLANMDVTLGVGEWRIEIEPTATSEGALKRNVVVGFETYVLPSLNSSRYNVQTETEATCTSHGKINYVTEVEGKSFTFVQVVPKKEHVEETLYAVAPTCTSTGLTAGKKCSLCNTIFVNQDIIEKLPHTEATEEKVEVTCDRDGVEARVYCTVCKNTLSGGETIAATGHSYDTFGFCERCTGNEYEECLSYGDLTDRSSVSETNGVVTIEYNNAKAISISIPHLALDANKTYIFKFASGAGKVRMVGNASTSYSNIRIEVATRSNAFSLLLQDMKLSNFNTIITSKAQMLNLGFVGSACSISTTKGSNGKAGVSGQSFVTDDVHGKSGGSANVAISCSGVLNITCGTGTTLKGGDGGNGGNGGDPSGLGANGGNGGNGGNGAHAISASAINVSFASGMTKDNISIKGGAGGSGGSGGDGTWLGSDGKAGSGGSSAQPSNVTINYV